MLSGIITLLTAFLIAGVAAWFSIAGLMSVFSASALAVAIMAGSLELGKLVTASWLYRNWHNTGVLLKSYLTFAVFVLMMITSLGIFGYLSKAHLDQAVPAGEVSARVQMIDEQIAVEQDTIDTSRKALAQMDAQVDQALSRTTDLRGTNRAVQIRRQQASERKQLQADIATAQAAISELRTQRAPIAGELRKVESEVGPIKYIAALIYGDNPDTNLLERAVRWMIILLVIVFDPLAVILLIAANKSLMDLRNPKTKAKPEQDQKKRFKNSKKPSKKQEASNLKLSKKLNTLTDWSKSPVLNALSKLRKKLRE